MILPGLDLSALATQGHPRQAGHVLSRPIVSKSVGEQLAERIVTAIALGLYVPGQRLPTERELAAMVGVSRTGVREAMHILADNGYVDIRRGNNGGAFVRTDWLPSSSEMVRRHLLPNWEEFDAVLDTRLQIESMLARLAAKRRTAAQVAEMRTAVEAYRSAADRESSRIADQQVHAAIARATGNSLIAAVSSQLRLMVSLNLGAEPYTSEARATAKDQHAELVDAVEAGDEDAAAAIAYDHFMITDRLLRSLVAKVTKEG